MLEEIIEQIEKNQLDEKLLTEFFNLYLRREVSRQSVVELLKAFSQVKDHETIKKFIEAEVNTGKQLEWPENLRPVIDKHSTGGVGDKVSLIVVPWIAACGLRVAKLSGRSLGHTGGTIDKIESIPGVSPLLDSEKFAEGVIRKGCLIAEPSNDICPVEPLLYELRNESDLVPYLPLVVASILSKKIATNADIIIFDVKVGKGAFFKDRESAEMLAKYLVEVSLLFNKKTSAILTSMDAPLGYAIGNSLEVLEAIEFLSGKNIDGLNEVVYAIAIQALCLAGFDEEEAFIKLESARNSGKALNYFVNMVEFLGGPSSLNDLMRKIPRAPVVGTFTSIEKGYIHSIDPLLISKAVQAASKNVKRPDTGIRLLVRQGQEIGIDDELCEIHALDYESLDKASDILENAFLIEETKPKPLEYVIGKFPI
ncbi:MAG: thymidine phosphorylase [Actinobacteria bacterium]|nr:thymidine phosphorylase [Actinomycetota bacterium]